jgi:hypothetical protein
VWRQQHIWFVSSTWAMDACRGDGGGRFLIELFFVVLGFGVVDLSGFGAGPNGRM